jgi:hypothetical protein
MTSEQAQHRIDCIWQDYELKGISEQWFMPGIKMKILRASKKIVFQIESSRHPQYQGIKKQVSYKTWEAAYAAYQCLIPEKSRVENLRGHKARPERKCLDKEPVLTVQAFIEWVCDQRTLVADAHADAVEHKKPEAFFWSYVDESMRNLMDACDEARAIMESEDDEADELTLPA